ncbi:guanitoxin biosynthesis L-enduracididine beta-hydroxylase GntD [Nocardia concava]|uniref:guanitoxin biosynthesis L-enduracididine beta-hydroxylase GntD n=1 Tax=Nocardia concava TaxID=257281 RepID=UPI000A064EB3|nr:guanitoxin biosynthesis L-enduracididine beta-hydroxylase GntD [Nocardia concava]
MAKSLAYYDLNRIEVLEIELAIEELLAADHDPGSGEFYDKAWELVPRVPAGLRKFLHEFRNLEPAAGCVVRGMPVDDAEVGPTPESWKSALGGSQARREELFLGLVAMSVGEVFNWATLQQGRMIHNVLPMRGEGEKQSGHGTVFLEWHTEDGFHPQRCEYLMLLGVRNHDKVPTILASLEDVELSDEHRKILSEPRFHILPDDEHLRQLSEQFPGHPALEVVQKMTDDPEPVPVLFGDSVKPYLRIDVPFMRCADDQAEIALKALVAEFDRVRQDIVLEAGDVLIVDNDMAVHGRAEYTARFDGTDRWLKKLLVTRDLRAARTAGALPGARVLC